MSSPKEREELLKQLENEREIRELWREKLNDFEKTLAVAFNPEEKFQLQKKIQECEKEIKKYQERINKIEEEINYLSSNSESGTSKVTPGTELKKEVESILKTPLPSQRKSVEPQSETSESRRLTESSYQKKEPFRIFKNRRQLRQWLGWSGVTIGTVVLVILGLAQWEHLEKPINDDDFLNKNWSQENLFDESNNSSPPNVYQKLQGGRDKEYQEGIIVKGVGLLAQANFYKEEIYDPLTQGAISSIEFSYDFIVREITSGYGQLATMFFLEQDGVLFTIKPPTGYFAWLVHTPGFNRPSGEKNFPKLPRPFLPHWVRWSCKGLTSEDFEPFSEYVSREWGGEYQGSYKGESGMKPNFSATGGVISFGYLTARSGHSNQFKIIYGIDNWKVKIYSKTTPISGWLRSPSCFPDTSREDWRAEFTEEDRRNTFRYR